MTNNFDPRDTPITTEAASAKTTGDEARVPDHEPGGGGGANENMNVNDRVAWSIDGRNQAAHEEIHHTLRRGRDSSDAVVIVSREYSQAITASRGTGFRGDGTPREPFVITTTGVRRLTPREHERLQGFKDDHTLVEYRGKPATDSPRFKAIGNSIAVPVMQWIGRRIAAAFTMNDRHRPIPKFARPVPKPRDWIRRRRPGQNCNNPVPPEPHK
jgi:site-specific DNA-cytosine methylase